MRICPYPTVAAMEAAAASSVLAVVRARAGAHLCLATGASPTGTYAAVALAAVAEPGLLAAVRVAALDEWVGLPRGGAGTCAAYLERHVLGPLAVAERRRFLWDSGTADPEAECRRAAAWLEESGRFDVAVLGLGLNGHLGLNEPAAVLRPGPHVASLAERTRGHAMLTAAGAVVEYGLTFGVGDLLRSRRVLVVVPGVEKRAALERLAEPVVDPGFPASFLWLHGDVEVMTVGAAGGGPWQKRG